MRSRTAVVLTALAGSVLLTGCGSASSEAVTSSKSLDTLGAQLAKDADAAAQIMASGLQTQADVSAKADEDVSCPGGHRREYAAKVTGDRSAAGAGSLNNTESMVLQSTLKPIGYALVTDVDGDVPAKLTFVNNKGTAADKRIIRTTLTTSGDQFTLAIAGETACVK